MPCSKILGTKRQELGTQRWGIDLGGTKIEGVILDDKELTKPLCRLRVPTERNGGYNHILSQIQLLIAKLEEVSGFTRPAHIGIGTPGIIDPFTRVMKNSNTTCLNGRPMKEDLSEALGIEISIANDANCFALAEATMGAARGFNVVMGLIIGTGVGGGLVLGGRLHQGLHGISGEWGHNTMRGEEASCYCGKQGCTETVFSGPALEDFYENLTGEKIPLPEVVRRAHGGETAAVQTIARLQEKFAEAIAVPINIFDPDAIVIGGGVGAIDLLYAQSTRHKIAYYVFNNECQTKILRPALGNSAGVFGAAMLG